MNMFARRNWLPDDQNSVRLTNLWKWFYYVYEWNKYKGKCNTSLPLFYVYFKMCIKDILFAGYVQPVTFNRLS